MNSQTTWKENCQNTSILYNMYLAKFYIEREEKNWQKYIRKKRWWKMSILYNIFNLASPYV